MITIKETTKDDVIFIEACLKNKDEYFTEQCGYGSRFFNYPVTYDQILYFQENIHPNSKFFTIFLSEYRIGSLELMLKPDEQSGTIARFLIADDYRFQGHGTEAIKRVIEYSFSVLHLRKINLCVFDFNLSAKKCYENAGFHFTYDEIRPNGYKAIYMEVTNSWFYKNKYNMFYDTMFLRNDEIILKLTKTVEPNLDKDWLPAYHFDICLPDGTKAGICDLRVGYNQKIYYGGNIGYTVYPEHRGHRYAAKACLLLFGLAKKHGMDNLIITCNPDNHASRKTCEYAGGTLETIVDLLEDNDMYMDGERQKCIYRFSL